jgi:hypothetical protein
MGFGYGWESLAVLLTSSRHPLAAGWNKIVRQMLTPCNIARLPWKILFPFAIW